MVLGVFWADRLWMDAAALVLAVVLDIVLGEPPAALHPVVYMGRLAAWLERRAPKAGRAAQFAYGLGMALGVPAVFAGAGYFVAAAAGQVSPVLYIIVVALLLKTCFSVRGLARAARAVEAPLRTGKLEAARLALGALVSRDTSRLTAAQAASAAVESVSENITDSFAAPWLAFALFGLPGVLAYRAVNTLDAMIGYRGKYEYLGKASARLDDVLNFVPARLSALAIAAVSLLRHRSARGAFCVMVREGGATESPNAGVTMSAMAGALGVTLEKVDHYCLGRGLRQPEAGDIAESVRLMWWTAGLTGGLALASLAVRHAIV